MRNVEKKTLRKCVLTTKAVPHGDLDLDKVAVSLRTWHLRMLLKILYTTLCAPQIDSRLTVFAVFDKLGWKYPLCCILPGIWFKTFSLYYKLICGGMIRWPFSRVWFTWVGTLCYLKACQIGRAEQQSPLCMFGLCILCSVCRNDQSGNS